MGGKQSSEPSTTAFTTRDLPRVSPTQHSCSLSELLPGQGRVLQSFQSPALLTPDWNLQFVPWPSLLWCPFCSGHMNSIRPVSTAVPGHQAAPRVTLKEGENTYGRSLVPSMKWKWHQAPIPVSVWRDSCPQPHYSIGLIQNFPNPNCSTSS